MSEHRKIILLTDLSESYFRNITRGIARYADIYGPWSFCKMPPFFREKYGIEGILEFAKDWEADGIVGQFYNSDEIHKLIDAGLYILAADFREQFNNIPNISGNYHLSGQMAAEYFLAKGFQHFAYYGFNETVWSREREIGYRERLQKEGIVISSYTPETVSSHNFWFYKPSPLQEWIKSLPMPVAIFTCDDGRSEHLTQAARLAQVRIPEEAAILGVDNDEILCKSSTPPLSSIAQDENNAGYQAAQLLDKMMKEKRIIHQDIQVQPLRVITRQSTDILAMSDEYVRKALIFIQENLEKKIAVNDLTREIPLSRRALEKRFLKGTGRTIYQEIVKQRMQKVMHLLLESNLSMTEIAVLCGYDDNKNLSRSFRTIYGQTPLQYRKKYRYQE